MPAVSENSNNNNDSKASSNTAQSHSTVDIVVCDIMLVRGLLDFLLFTILFPIQRFPGAIIAVGHCIDSFLGVMNVM